jgi:hypothetical protein
VKIAALEKRLTESFLRDARRRRNRTVTLTDDLRVVTVQISGVTAGLAYAVECATGERDALARVLERLDPNEEGL